LRPGFDVLLSLPDSPLALRLRHLADDVDITLVRHHGPAGAAEPPTSVPPGPEEPPPAAPVPTAPPAGPGVPPLPEGHVASDLAAMLWQDVGPPPD
jgi:hypothetical protein